MIKTFPFMLSLSKHAIASFSSLLGYFPTGYLKLVDQL
jgi:hypothetical protein